MNGVGNLDNSIRSQSIQGFSLVVAIFREGTEVMRARQMVSERLAQVGGQLPSGVRAPVMAPLTSSTSLIFVVGLRSAKRTPMEFLDLRRLDDAAPPPRRARRGERGRVRREVREIQVQLLPERLGRLRPAGLLRRHRDGAGGHGSLRRRDSSRPRPSGSALKTEGQALTADEVGEVVVGHHAGASVRLRDVARVLDGPEPKLGDAAVNGEPGVLLQVWSQYGTNTKDVTIAVEEALAELEPVLKAAEIQVADPPLFRPASFIDLSIHNINVSLLIGGVLVAVVLTLFLFNLRTAFISIKQYGKLNQ